MINQKDWSVVSSQRVKQLEDENKELKDKLDSQKHYLKEMSEAIFNKSDASFDEVLVGIDRLYIASKINGDNNE